MQILMSVLWVLTTVQGMLTATILKAVLIAYAMRDTLVMELFVTVNMQNLHSTLPLCLNEHLSYKKVVTGLKMMAGSNHESCLKAFLVYSCLSKLHGAFKQHKTQTKRHATTTKLQQTRSPRAHIVFDVLLSQNSRRTPRTYEQL